MGSVNEQARCYSTIGVVRSDHGFTDYKRLFTERFYGSARVDGYHDDIASIQYRLVVGPAAGYYFIKSDASKLSLVSSAPRFIDERLGHQNQSYVTLRFSERGEHTFNKAKSAKVWEEVDYMPQVDDFGNYLLIRQPQGFTEDKLDLAARLLLAGDDAARCLQLIEDTARQALQTENHQTMQALAQGVSASQFPALGILLYRSVLPLAAPDRAAQWLEQVLMVRDRLNLPLDDPFSDVIDRRLAELKDEARDAAALREAQHRLDGKVQEVQQLKESMIRLQREISRRESRPQPAPRPADATSVPADEAALRELREKVETLREALKERHNERNTLRRELQKAQSDLDALRQSAAPAAPDESEPDHEEELLLPQDTPEIHPVRLIEFPKGFQQTLEFFPRQVARAAVIMVGRLAAGEPAAFVGALRLKQVPNVMRQRIGWITGCSSACTPTICR